MTAKHTWAVGVGRTLVRDGVPVGRFTRETEPPTLTPSEADDLTRDIAAGLNAHDALTAQRDQLLEAARFLLSRLDDGSGQQMRVYSDTLHPTDDDKTVVHLLREAIQAAEGER